MKRYAHVWSPHGLVELPVVREYPDAISFGPDVYFPDLGPDGELLVATWGRDAVLDYRQRREATADEAATIAELPTVHGRLIKAMARLSVALGRAWCGLKGHDYHREGRWPHVALVCWSCGKETPGWDL